MRPSVWRAIALVCIAAAIAFVLYEPTLPQNDDFGLSIPIGRYLGKQVTVTAVEPGSQAARAQIRPGDRVSFGSTIAQRARAKYALPGTHVQLLVNGSRTVVVTAHRMPPVGDWNITAVRLAFLLVAGLLALRRPEDTGARFLTFFLWCFGCAIALPNGLLPWPLLSFAMGTAAGVLFVLGTAAAAGFAANFPTRTKSGTVNAVLLMCECIAVVTAAALVALYVWPPAGFIAIGGFGLVVLLAVTVFAMTYARGAAVERQRRRWVFLIVGFALCGLIADVMATNIAGHVVVILDELALVPLGLLPIGLAYVILRHRVIDVGFVLNRAVVYTGVSAVIVGVFVIVETLLAKYVENRNHITSLAVELAVALALGFSIRYVHERVDRLVDNLLFRERHLAEAAIREFAHDAPYITDAVVLLARCVATVERYAGANAAGVWVADGARYRDAASTFPLAAEIDENDPAVVAMRARRVNVHLRDCGSALPGFLAFPMIVRGELLGILVCGQKRNDETYAPDEQDALASLAAGVGHALDAIEVRDLRRRLDALTATSGGQPAF